MGMVLAQLMLLIQRSLRIWRHSWWPWDHILIGCVVAGAELCRHGIRSMTILWVNRRAMQRWLMVSTHATSRVAQSRPLTRPGKWAAFSGQHQSLLFETC